MKNIIFTVSILMFNVCAFSANICTFSNSENLSPYLSVLPDASASLTFEKLVSDSLNHRFAAFSKKNIDKNIPVYWFSFSLENPIEQDRDLYLGFGDMSEYIHLYEVFPDNKYKKSFTGASVPVDNKTIKTGKDNILKITIPAQSAVKYYVKIENKSVFGKQFLAYMTEYFAAHSPQYFESNYIRGRIFNSFYYGAIFIMFFYNLFLAISLKSKDYVSYVVFCVSFFVFNMLSDGYPSETCLSHLPIKDRLYRIYAAPITFISYIVFSRIYLKTYQFIPKWDKFYYVLVGMLALCYVPLLLEHYWIGRNAVTYVLILFIVYYAIVSIICYQKGYKPAGFYIAANSLLLTAGVLYGFYLTTLIPHNSFTRFVEFLPQIASIFELAIFSLGLSQRIKIAETENAQAQAQTIELLTENERMIKKQNEILEEKVALRTEELLSVNEELNVINHELNSSLNQIEKEKQKTDRLLLNILPEPVAKELKESGTANPTNYETVTVLFADFVNFTRFAANHSPNEIVRKLDGFFLAFDMICEKYGLEKIKTIGDCYMAAGGLPLPNTTNPFDVAHAALEMMDSIKDSGWELRIGIHTGPVVAGVIGINKFAYDVWGDAVNVASRMESASENNKINISVQTYEAIKNIFLCEYRGKIYAKNKGDIDMYFLLGKK